MLENFPRLEIEEYKKNTTKMIFDYDRMELDAIEYAVRAKISGDVS